MLDLAEILVQADGRVQGRGRDLLTDNAITKAERDGNVLHARVEGSAPHPYRVTIDLERGEWSCTCPYDFGDVCKHVFAVALAGLETPELFRTARKKRKSSGLPALLEQLEGLSEEDVLKLLETLEQLHPEVLEEFSYNLQQRNDGW
jgi:uncharacterized Zn finger protein